MPIDVSPGSVAAATIAVLFWWTVCSPAALLAIAVLCGRTPRLRGVLTLVVLVPPLLTLLPVAVMRGGLAAAAAAAAALVIGGALILDGASLLRVRRDPAGAERNATAALVAGVAGGITGSIALVLARTFT
jgi:hypothetical protein